MFTGGERLARELFTFAGAAKQRLQLLHVGRSQLEEQL
jgi:hypothetical protein